MSSVTSSVKRSNDVPSTDNSTRPTKITKRERFDPFKELHKELWVKVFTYLLPGDFRPLSLTCWEFSLLRLPSLYALLQEKKELTASDIRSLHPPFAQFLIYNNQMFSKEDYENEKREIQRLWTDHSVPKIYSHIIFHCPNLEIIDLRDNRFSLSTFLGDPVNFSGEVATQLMSDSLEFECPDEINPVVKPMLNTFDVCYPLIQNLQTVAVLKIFWNKSISNKDWDTCARAFPNLEILVLEKETIEIQMSDVDVKIITRKFSQLKKCIFINIKIVLFRPGSQSLELEFQS